MAANSQGRGRPPKYQGNLRRAVVALIRKHGLTGTQSLLAEGIRYKPNPRKRAVRFTDTVSLPTLASLASDAGIKLSRGPRKVAA